MGFLVRKINRPKWDIISDEVDYIKVQADAVTSCLRTQSNSLSFWLIEKVSDLNEVLIALSTTYEHLETSDFVYFKEDLMNDSRIEIKQTDGNTNYSYMKGNHREFCNLDYEKLGDITKIIFESIIEEKWRRYNKQEIKDIIDQKIDQKLIRLDDFKEGFQRKLIDSH